MRVTSDSGVRLSHMLTISQQRTLVSIWNALEDEHDDVSTERLFAMTCDRASQQMGITVDDGDVSGALAKFGRLVPLTAWDQ
jgi:hypothetical protein